MVKELIHVALREALGEKQYDCDAAKTWTREIGDSLQAKLKGIEEICRYMQALGILGHCYNLCIDGL